ncbi:hypothetical protein ACETU7_14315 [Rhodococcus sp. 3Y1]
MSSASSWLVAHGKLSAELAVKATDLRSLIVVDVDDAIVLDHVELLEARVVSDRLCGIGIADDNETVHVEDPVVRWRSARRTHRSSRPRPREQV